jgi:hypothetical protein
MGKYVLLILLSMGFYAVEAQVTTISINKENFQSSGFPFKEACVTSGTHSNSKRR